MSIAARTRKLLWGRSGSRCAFCRIELIQPKSHSDDESIVGDECHIISSSPNGPRYDPDYPPKKIDTYENLLILCKVHHKLVDDQCSTFTADILRKTKSNHEEWVSSALRRLGNDESGGIQFLVRLLSGKGLVDLLSSVHGFYRDYDQPKTDDESQIVEVFFQAVSDWLDLDLAEIEVGFRASKHLDEIVNDLDRVGYWVFGCQVTEKRPEAMALRDLRLAHLKLVRATSDEILHVDV